MMTKGTTARQGMKPFFAWYSLYEKDYELLFNFQPCPFKISGYPIIHHMFAICLSDSLGEHINLNHKIIANDLFAWQNECIRS